MRMTRSDQKEQLRPVPFAVGMLIAGVTGFALWMATDTFVLFPAFMGMGVVLGILFSRPRRDGSR